MKSELPAKGVPQVETAWRAILVSTSQRFAIGLPSVNRPKAIGKLVIAATNGMGFHTTGATRSNFCIVSKLLRLVSSLARNGRPCSRIPPRIFVKYVISAYRPCGRYT